MKMQHKVELERKSEKNKKHCTHASPGTEKRLTPKKSKINSKLEDSLLKDMLW